MKNDSLNVISWVTPSAVSPSRFQFYLNEIWALSSSMQVTSHHVGREANSFTVLFQSSWGGSCNFFIYCHSSNLLVWSVLVYVHIFSICISLLSLKERNKENTLLISPGSINYEDSLIHSLQNFLSNCQWTHFSWHLARHLERTLTSLK